jgi:ArsR family transcriptional regulator, nickel/cobalt-responsive transcriptional repressor
MKKPCLAIKVSSRFDPSPGSVAESEPPPGACGLCRSEQLFSYSVDMAHGENQRAPAELDAPFVRAVADTMQALATPSRLRILGRLHAGPCPVNELAAAAGMEPSAVSHQLRVLRHLGLVVGRREGRQVVYYLYDDHVGELLEQAISHVEHLRLGRSRSVLSAELLQAR